MRNLRLLFICFLIGCASDQDMMPDDQTIGERAEAAYDESLIPTPSQPLDNIIANGDFETDDGAWSTCGNARITSINDASSGDQVMVFGRQGECPTERYSRNVTAVATQELPINALADVLTISFQVRSNGTLPASTFNIYLSNTPDESYSFGGYRVGYITQRKEDDDSWSKITFLATKEQIEESLDATTPLYLSFQLEAADEGSFTTVQLDDVIVTNGFKKRTQPEPMPDALLNYAGDSRILFYKLSNGEEIAASMKPNGTDLVLYNQIPATVVEGAARWFDEHQIVLAQKVFNPTIPSDPRIQPGGGTDVIKYNLITGEEELVYRTVGEPGIFLFADAIGNVAALDVEVRRMAWDTERNRGVLSICGRNRSYQFELNSDDLCYLYIIDATTYEVINQEVKGYAPEWSRSGKLAYYYDNKLYVAEISGNDISTNVVYEHPSLLQIMDWSPDETQLVFARMGAGNTVVDGEIASIYSIKTLDIATGEEKTLLQVDQGNLIGDLSWSPDGDFIVYSLNVDGGGAQVWWLEVATGKTGPITNTTNGYGATWQK